MGREEATEDNPMGYVPPVIIPENADELLAESRAAFGVTQDPLTQESEGDD